MIAPSDREDPQARPDAHQRDEEQPSSATVKGLLETIAATYQNHQDVERWVKARLSAWYSSLRGSTCGEMREAWRVWESSHNEAPTKTEFLREVYGTRNRKRTEVRPGCAHCVDQPGMRTIMIRRTVDGKYHHADEILARCDCAAGDRYVQVKATADRAISLWPDALKRYRSEGLVAEVETKDMPRYKIRRAWEGRATEPEAVMPPVQDLAAYLNEEPRERDCPRDWNEPEERDETVFTF